MKKYLLKIAACAFIIGTLASCEEDKVFQDVNNGQALAGFNADSGDLKAFDPNEFTTPSEIIIEVGVTTKSNQDRAIQVVVNEELSTALPSQYTVDTSSLVIPAGEYVAKVKITANYDALPETESTTLVLDLISVEGMDLLDSDRSRFVAELFRVCPRDIPTTYTGFVTGSVGAGTEEFTVTFTAGTEVATYSTPNLWGNFVSGATGSNQYDGQYPYNATLVINCDNTVDVTGNVDYATGGTGTFDPNTNEFQLYLGQGLFTQQFTADVYLMPVQ